MTDILDIHLTSHAARPAHMAATEIATLLGDAEGVIANWGLFDVPDPEALESVILRCGDYIERKGCRTGERLYLWARIEGLVAATRPETFEALTFRTRLAYDLFVEVFAGVHRRLKAAQDEAGRALDLETRPAPAAPALEDTIYAPMESLGALRPEAQAAAAHQAKHASAKAKAKTPDAPPPTELTAGETVAKGQRKPARSPAA